MVKSIKEQHTFNSFSGKILQFSLLAIMLVININGFTSINEIAIAMYLILLLLVFLFQAWTLLNYAIFLVLSQAYIIYPSIIWNIPAMIFLIPFLISALIILPVPSARQSLTWFKWGKIDKNSWILMIITAIVAAGSLIIWGIWSNNLGASVQLIKKLAGLSDWVILGIIIPSFALINAFAEEAVFRSITQQALIDVFKNKTLFPIIIQATVFAAAHVAYGFPNGKIGYLMTFCFACVLGYLRLRTKGIFLPYITHVLADLVIGYFLFIFAG